MISLVSSETYSVCRYNQAPEPTQQYGKQVLASGQNMVMFCDAVQTLWDQDTLAVSGQLWLWSS